MKVLLILLLFSFDVFAEDMTVTKFKEIINGKETKSIRKEIKHIHILRKCSVNFTLNYPNQKPFKVNTTATEKYVANKFIVSTIQVPNNKPFYSILLWNEKEKSIQYWLMDPAEKITYFKGKEDKKRKSRIHWKGKNTSGENYEGYTDYSKSLISWEGKYTRPDGTSYTESGNSTPIE